MLALLLAVQAVDADGFRVHTLTSPRQTGETVVRVLLPDKMEGRLPVVYVLPVEAGRESTYGDGLLEAKRLGLHNRHGVICVAPTFSRLPWYADHPSDPAIAQESYLLKDVLPLVEGAYPTSHRLLLGFSKSGHGAFSLLLRHPELFQRALAWDAPLMMDHFDRFGSGQVYGSAENFKAYRPSELLGKLGPELRLLHMGFDAFRDHHEAFEKLLKVPHVYRDGPPRAHRWDSGWLAPAFSLLVDPPRTSSPVDLRPPFRDRLQLFVWRNWTLVPPARMAEVVGAKPEDVLALGRSMGLPDPPPVSDEQWARSYITIIRRNWHLLPLEQLRALLGWTAERLDFILREDDFLSVKLGAAKPEPLRWSPTSDASAIAEVVKEEFPDGVLPKDPPFSFVKALSAPAEAVERPPSRFSPRFAYSYFALYGDPLLDADPYPDGYLARLAASGVDGVWLQAVLYQLAPFPWEPAKSARHEERRASLLALVERAKKHGIGVWLYFNEPRAMPLAFFEKRPELKGVVEGDHAALCTSSPEVRRWLEESVASLAKAVPGLAGIFTITASENLSNCASHGRQAGCARCSLRPYAEVVNDVNAAIAARIQLIAWDWGWKDPTPIAQLPANALFMSVSEWGLAIERGGVKADVGEYALSAIGPGPRATKHWALARERGLKTVAKIQAANTWELSAVPYIPAVENTAIHAANLRKAGVDGLMLGWTLGGYPSPNLEVVAELGRPEAPSADEALERVAKRRYGSAGMVAAWKEASAAFREFPFHIGTVYKAPLQFGPSNPLWEAPTGRSATMIGFPFDDLNGWRAVYPPDVFASQLEKVADGFDRAALLAKDVEDERRLLEACACHFRSTANQSRFVVLRSTRDFDALERLLKSELTLAKRLHALQSADSRLGFEASNHYYYVSQDLVEKALNVRDLLDRWLPKQRASW